MIRSGAMARTNTKAKSSRQARPARSRTAGKRATQARRARPRGRGRSQSRSAAASAFTTMARRLGAVAKKMTEMMTQKSEAEDAGALLERDHREVEGVLDPFAQAGEASTKQRLTRQSSLTRTG